MPTSNTSATNEVLVEGLPSWIVPERLLGAGDWQLERDTHPDGHGCVCARAVLEREASADLAARLRGVGLDGQLLRVSITPALSRGQIRAARTRDARARRNTTPGFTRPGVKLDEDGRVYLTPESLALRVGQLAKGRTVIDAGCGVGGNSIGFARAGCRVLAIELDRRRAAYARHNLRVYGQAAMVRVQEGDAIDLVRQLADGNEAKEQILFCDPPWGADWRRERSVPGEFPLFEALLELRPAFFELWAKLPASFAVHLVPKARAEALFGAAEGDRHRVKFVLVRV